MSDFQADDAATEEAAAQSADSAEVSDAELDSVSGGMGPQTTIE